MALLSLTVNDASPQLTKRHQEASLIVRALKLAEQAIGQGNGSVLSGTITNDGGAVLGNWTYTPAAPS
jgi:hypothetical protein